MLTECTLFVILKHNRIMCGLLDQQLHYPLHKVNKKRGDEIKYFIFQTLRSEAVHYVAFQLLQTSLTNPLST